MGQPIKTSEFFPDRAKAFNSISHEIFLKV